MNPYKHTQIGHLMIAVALAMLCVFGWAQITARMEPASIDAGTNLLVTAIMTLVVLIPLSFATLTTSVNEKYLLVTFGFGIFRKKFALDKIASVRQVRNHWYYGWGIRLWLKPKMWIYNVSGFDAVELATQNGNVYRIGTDDPRGLETALKQAIH